MARELTEIISSIKTQVRTHPELDVFLFVEDGGSAVSIFNLFISITGLTVFTYENIHDAFAADIQAISDKAMAGNTAWLQDQILKFQNGDSVTLVDFVPTYSPVVVANRIVTRAAVVDGNPVTIKVAKGVVGSLVPLSAGELTALQNYYFGTSTSEGIGFAGVFAQFVNLLPDRMFIEADVYYEGQFIQATTKTAVIDAIDAFFNTFQDNNFNGNIFIETLRDKIQLVPGVTRIDFTSIKTRAESIPFGSASTQDIQGVYQTIAGYLISEDTTGETLTDKITMVEETL